MLTREGILKAKDLPTKAVPVPEWGEGAKCAVVHVRTLTALEVESLKGIDEGGNFLGRFAVMVMCDEKGRRLFTDEDADAMGTKSNSALRRVCNAAQALNGIETEAQEEAVKN